MLLSPLQSQQILTPPPSLVASRSGAVVGDVDFQIKPLSSILLIHFLTHQSLARESGQFLQYKSCFPSIISILQSYRQYSGSLSAFFRRNPLIQYLCSLRRHYIILSLVKAGLPFINFSIFISITLQQRSLVFVVQRFSLKKIVKITREDFTGFFYYIVTIN